MSTTAQTIAENALMEIGVLAQGEAASGADTEFCRGKLNRIIGVWRTRRLFVPYLSHDSYPWVTSKQSYTIGPSGADFTAARPNRIEGANLIVVGSLTNTRNPLEIIDHQQYAAISIPALSGLPSRLYYQPTVPSGTLWPWPYPTDTTDQLELITWKQLAEFTDPSTGQDLADGYEEALTMDLAESLCSAYGKSVTPQLVEMARRAKAAIQSANTKAPLLVNDACESGGGYRIETGPY